MIPSKKCYDLIKSFEGLELKAYVDPGTGNLPITIGYGSTMYEDGRRIKLGDVIPLERAEMLFEWEVDKKAKVIDAIDLKVTQSQFDAIVSFAYNVGVGALRKSTLLKKVKANPNDKSIAAEFLKWNKSGGKAMAGLTRRRQAEADLYFY